MAADEKPALTHPDQKLKKDLTRWQLLFISLGTMIGSGWLFTALAAASAAGPLAILAWIIGAILIIFVALNWAEVSCAVPRSGALARYPYLTHGGFLGFMVAWTALLGGIATPAIEAIAVVTYASGYVKKLAGIALTTTRHGVTILSGPGIVAGVILMAFFFFINFFGVKLFAKFNKWITWWKLIVPTVTFILLFMTFDGSNFTEYDGIAPQGPSSLFTSLISAGVVFSFIGFRYALEFGGEARNPQKDLPIVTILAVVIVAAIYTALQIGFIGAINWSAAGISPGDWSGLSGSKWADQPLYDALNSSGIALFGAFGAFLLIDAAVSPAGTGWIFTGGTARNLYGIAMQGDLPRPLRRVNARYGIPWVALIATIVVGLLFLLPIPSWYELVGLIVSLGLLTMTMGAVNLRVLRRTVPDLPRPFRLRGIAIMGPLGALSGSMLFYWTGFGDLRFVIAATFIALPIYAMYRAPRQGFMKFSTGATVGIPFVVVWVLTQYFGAPGRDSLNIVVYVALTAVEVVIFAVATWLVINRDGRKEIRASWWAIFLQLALYILSYYGAYGPQHHPAMPFPWDSLIAVVIGLISYYWAVATGYLTDEARTIADSANRAAAESEL